MPGDQSPTVILYDKKPGEWRHYEDPVEVIAVYEIGEVWDAMVRFRHLVIREQFFGAGFVSYEAAPAFDQALRTKPGADIPLVWFGLFRKCRPSRKLLRPGPENFVLNRWRSEVTPEEYSKSLHKIRKELSVGNTYQVNYSYRQRASFHGDPFSLFYEMTAHGSPPDYAAYLSTEDFTLCSASPELFFRHENSELFSEPMKGTRARGRTLTEDRGLSADLYYSEKDRAENVMIVDMVRNDMGRIAQTGSVTVPHLYEIRKYPTVWQMISQVKCRTNAPLEEVFKAMFPCASVTGAPKASTMEIIAVLEKSPRKIYTGSIGFFDPDGAAQFNVAIRTALIDKNIHQIEYGTGGGIIWDSSPESEFRETLDKTKAITNPEPEFLLLETLLWEPEDGFYLLPYHITRLQESAQYFGFQFSKQSILEALKKQSEQFAAISVRVRLLLSRNGEMSIQNHKVNSDNSLPVQVALARTPVDRENRFLYHKTTCRSFYNSIRSETEEADEILLWNENGEMTESTIANLVISWKKKLITPPISCGLLPGTMRQYLLEQGTITEAIITREMLATTDQIFLINSVRKWRKAELISPSGQ